MVKAKLSKGSGHMDDSNSIKSEINPINDISEIV